MASEQKDRYPGLRPFRVDEKDVFYGRDVEARELTDLVRAERSVILFSKSGLGKSSLLNARVCPQLIAHGFWPILIRFQPQTYTLEQGFSPVEVVIDRLRAEFDMAYQNLAKQVTDWKNEVSRQPAPLVAEVLSAAVDEQPLPADDKHKRLTEAIEKGENHLRRAKLDGAKFVPAQPILFNSEEPQLWEYVKTHRFPNDEIPVFVFDQFEEFFAYPLGNQQVFAQELAELLHDQPPTRVMNWLLDIPPFKRQPETMAWGKQPILKCLLSIRSDRLYEIDSLRQYIPLIVRNGYRLNPLHDDQARDAIDKPAQAEGSYRTPKFRFAPAIREKIITDLSNDDCEIESSQLQIVCNHFERYVLENYADKQLENSDEIVIDKLDDSHTIKRILYRFYRNQLRTLGGPEDIELARQVLEKELVINHHRVGLAEVRMKELMEGRTDLIEKLEEARLIRAEETHLGKTYELSHDTLIEPVENVRQFFVTLRQREARERERVREREAQLETNRQLLAQQTERAEKRRQRRWLRRRQVGAVFVVLFAIAAVSIYRQVLKNRLLAKANSDWASDEYDAGNHRKAYRLWESGDDLLSFFGFHFTSRLQDSTSTRLMAPFAGINTQINPSDTSLHIVANLYKGSYFEVWEKIRDSSRTTADSIYRKIDWLDEVGLKAATQLRLLNNRLVVFNSDSTLQVVDLLERQQIFPITDAYPFPSLNTLLSKGRVTTSENGAVRPIPTVLLPPSGNGLAVLDTGVQAHLYDLGNKGKEHELFRSVARRITGFNLNDLTFSASENFLLIKNPGANQYDLLALRTNQKPKAYVNTVYADFSPSGKYLTTISTSGQLVIRELSTQQVQYTGSVWQPGRTAQLAELAFNRDESTVMIAVKNRASGQERSAFQYNLFAVNLSRPNPSLVVIVKNCTDYQAFAWANHVLFSGGMPAASYNYNLTTGSKQALPSARYFPVKIGKTSLLYTHSPADKRLFLYDVLSGNEREITRFVSTNGLAFAFYAPPNGPDQSLIQATASSLTSFSIRSFPLVGMCVYADQKAKIKPGDHIFEPGSLRVSGPLIHIKNRNGLILSFFADTRKNQSDYLKTNVYPQLTEKDLSDAGLLKE